MSRYEVPAINPNHKVIVGWDHPLLTFFLQVIDRKREGTDNHLLVWRGTNRREIYEVDRLAVIARPYAILSNEIRSTLYGDKDEGK